MFKQNQNVTTVNKQNTKEELHTGSLCSKEIISIFKNLGKSEKSYCMYMYNSMQHYNFF